MTNLRNPSASVSAAIAGALGAVACLVFFGTAPLDPQRVAWLMEGDPGAHYLAWTSFRQAPWTFPLGEIDSYGREFASNILFADGIPLVSIPLKLASDFLPEHFQFFGWWTLFCFAMQGIFAALLLRLFSAKWDVLILGSAIFILAPPLLLRVGNHFALAAHWLILAALYLFFSRSVRNRAMQSWLLWTTLLVIASWVHAYLLAMVLAVWALWLVAEIVGLWQSGRLGVRSAIFFGSGVAGTGLVLGGAMAVIGYFLEMGLGTTRFRDYGMNLLAFVQPSQAVDALIPAHGTGRILEFEGFNYLGAGGVLLVLAGTVAAVAAGLRILRGQRPEPTSDALTKPLVLASGCLLLVVAASGFHFHVGASAAEEIPLPEIFEDVMNIFRACGRFGWSVFYCLLLGASVALSGLSALVRIPLLCVVVLVQSVDFSRLTDSMTRPFYARLEMDDEADSYSDPRWQALLENAKAITFVPEFFWRMAGHEYVLAQFALDHRKPIDSAAFARYPASESLAPRWFRLQDFWTGHLDPSELYIVERPALDARNLQAWERLIPANAGLLVCDHWHIVTLHPDFQGAREWNLEEFSGSWPILDRTTPPPAPAEIEHLAVGGSHPDSEDAIRVFGEHVVLGFVIADDSREESPGPSSLELVIKHKPEPGTDTHPPVRVQISLENEQGERTQRHVIFDTSHREHSLLLPVGNGRHLLALDLERQIANGNWLPVRRNDVYITHLGLAPLDDSAVVRPPATTD